MFDENLNDRELQITSSGDQLSESLPWRMPGSFGGLPVYRGYFRGDKPASRAVSDGQVVGLWIQDKASRSTNTAQRYRREAERLMLWAASKGKVISDLHREDFIEFGRFLSNPSPADDWIMTRRLSRTDPQWKPFLGPLSEQSRYQCLNVLYGLMEYLRKVGWTISNTMPAPQAPRTSGDATDDISALTSAQVDALRTAVMQTQDPLERARLRWATELLILLGPRTSDLVNGVMKDIQPEALEGSVYWVWKVRGKGNKPAKLPLTDNLLQTLSEYRVQLGLPALPEHDEPPYPILPRFRGSRTGKPESLQPMTRNGIYKRIQSLYIAAAEILQEKGLSAEARAITRATTHDLKHTALKRLADKSRGDMRLVQKLGRHSSLATTGQYAASSLADLAEKLQTMGD